MQKRSMTPEKLVQILDKHGTLVSIEKAEKILDLIYKLSNLSVKETLSQLPEHHTKKNRLIFKRHTRKKINHENSRFIR